MKEVIFATSNTGKIATLRRHIDVLGADIKIIQKSLDLIEPQANTSAEVARSKAEQAYGQLKKPVLVDDSSFHIEALHGFPGPFIRYMIDTVGVDGIIELMDGKSNRRAYFLSSLVYVDETGEAHIFEDEPYRGIIADKIDDFESKLAWSDLFKIFIPEGSDKVLGRMKAQDITRSKKEQTDAYRSFVEWMNQA